MNKNALVRLSLVALIVVFPFLSVAAAEPSAKEIMTKNDAAARHTDVKATAKLKTSGGTRKPSEKSFTWWRRLKDDGVRFETLTKFHAPAEVRDEAILLLEDEEENEVLIYLPSFKKVRRVESQQQSGSFMASDFSYADITAAHVTDFNHKTEKTENCPNTKTVKCWVIESIPARDSVRERMQYSKTKNWVRQDNYMVEKGEFYDLDGKIVKKLNVWDIKKMAGSKGDDRYFAHHLKMERVAGSGAGQSTQIDFSQVKVNQGVDRSLFAKQNLGKK